jgi:hypothetical protein
MHWSTTSFGGRRWAPMAIAVALAGCTSFFGSSEPETTASASPNNAVAAQQEGTGAAPIQQASSEQTGALPANAKQANAGEIDVRRYLGPDFCPEIRVRPGTEVLRRYEAGHEEEPAHVIWQASIGNTARECLYDGQGGLLLRIGVSGRVIAGPKGGPAQVAVPLRIAVVKYQEKVLANEVYPLTVTIPPANSTTFNEVKELNLPSPGEERDYIIYVGLDEKGEGLLGPAEEPVVAVKQPKRRIEPAPPEPVQAAAPAKPAEPTVLPTPSEGFILPQ